MENNVGRLTSMPPAGLCHRTMAWVIDWTLLTALHCTFFLLLGQSLSGLTPVNLAAALAAGTLFLVFFIGAPLLMIPLYLVVLHACGGQTVGKIIMGIKLVSTDGKPVSAGASFLRVTAVILSLLPLGAGFLWAAISRNRSAWHDIIAGTMVISAEQTS